MKQNRANNVLTILAILIVLIVVNFLASRHPFRVDLTENDIYTLSDSTKEILADLKDVITIRLYFTKDIPAPMQVLRRDVDDIVYEFKRAGGARLQIEEIDPNESATEEQKVAMMGIPPLQLNVVKKDKQEVAKIYLGIAVLYGGKQQVLPVVQNIDNLEYQLAEAIVKVSADKLQTIAWWSHDSGDSYFSNSFSTIREAVARRYEIKDLDDQIIADLTPEKYPLLVIISPREIGADRIFAIDQYLMKGGRIIALVDRWAITHALAAEPVSTNFNDLISHYGIAVDDKILLDRSNAMAAFSGGYVTYHMPYPYWLNIRKEQLSQSDPIVSDLESAVLPWTSPLSVVSGGDEGDGLEILASTSPYAVEVSPADTKMDPQSAGDSLLAGAQVEVPVIATAKGLLKSFYADGGATPPKGASPVESSSPNSSLFVAGSSHWLSDAMLPLFPANLGLFENAVDSYAMGDQLIGIRSRGATTRPLEILSQPAMSAIKYIDILIGPIVVVAIGMLIYFLRKSRHRAIQMAFK